MMNPCALKEKAQGLYTTNFVITVIECGKIKRDIIQYFDR